MRARIDIDHALANRNLLGAALGDLAPWQVWRVVLKAAFALGLGSDEERAIFEEISGGRALPAKRVRELWAVVARRGGKSRIAAAIGVYLALFVPRNLAPGEVGEVTIIAATREQASVVFKYVVGFLQMSPVLQQEIEVVTQHEVRLRGNVVLSTRAGTIGPCAAAHCYRRSSTRWRFSETRRARCPTSRPIAHCCPLSPPRAAC